MTKEQKIGIFLISADVLILLTVIITQPLESLLATAILACYAIN